MTAPSEYDSARRNSPLIEEFREIWRYRDLVVQLVRRDLLARYRRSVLGIVWTMLNPLGIMLVLTLAFSHAFGATPAYAVYVLAGLVAWNFFAQSTTAAMRQLLWGAGIMHRIYVPRTLFAVTAIGTGLVNLLLSLAPLLVVMLVIGRPPRLAFLFVAVSSVILGAFALGVGLLLSTLTVRFVDAAELYEVLMPAILYLTPIIYPAEIVPANYRWLMLTANPMHHLIGLFREPIYDGTVPALVPIATAAALAAVALLAGWAVFTRKADELPYWM